MMKPVLRYFLILSVVAISPVYIVAQYSRAQFVPGELLIKLDPDVGNGFFRSSNLEKLEELEGSGWTRVSSPKGVSLRDAQANLKDNPDVLAVQPNYYYYLDATPDDPRFGDLWGISKISAPAAWDTTTGSSTTIVAVIDTGIQYTHEDLAANIWTNPLEIAGNNIDDDSNGKIDDIHGYDFRFDDPDPNDEHGHGTHVAGTIGAEGNNTLGVAGVNWNVKLMAIKIYDSTGLGTTSAMLINAYNYITAMRQRGENIRVTNNSYSGCDEACGFDQATKDALDEMGQAGVLNVFAAGNANTDIDANPAYPGAYSSPDVFTVASSTSTDTRSGFSNFGVVNVDIAAPGSGILSTIFNGTGYGVKSGTSMASPHVAGAAALLSSHNPALSASSLKATLMNSADQLAAWDGVVKSGARLNVANALASQTQCDITLDPTSQFSFPEGGNFQISVSADDNCDYAISKAAGADLLTITSDDNGSGDSTITYTVGNNSGLPRGGKILVGDKEFQVSQSSSKIFPHRGFVDFGGDGRTDFAAIQNVGGQMIWHVFGLNDYSAFSFGLFDIDTPIPGHFDSDLINDYVVWRRTTGTFYVYKSSTASVEIVQFGQDGDNPLVTQDFDGDGIADFAVTRKQNGKLIWYVLQSSDGEVDIFQFGNETDKPIRGDYDGDGKADPAVYRPQAGTPANTFFVLRSSDQSLQGTTFGLSDTDELVPNDFDGDGKTDIAVWRSTTGAWHLLKSSDGAYQVFQFGLPGDLPTPGDYDGDGRTDYSVWRPGISGGQGRYYIYSVLSGFSVYAWGNDSMIFPAEVVRTP